MQVTEACENCLSVSQVLVADSKSDINLKESHAGVADLLPLAWHVVVALQVKANYLRYFPLHGFFHSCVRNVEVVSG